MQIGGAGDDLIRGGAGIDELLGGLGNDALVVVGVNLSGTYTASDISNPNGTGVDLSSLLDLNDINNNAISDVAHGGIIDGGTDGATLFIYGDVDLTGVTLINITIINVHSILTLSAAQINTLIAGGFTGMLGDGNSQIIIKDSAVAVTIDLSSFDLSGIAQLTIGSNVTLIADQADIASLTIIDGTGKLQASTASNILDLDGKSVATAIALLDSNGAAVTLQFSGDARSVLPKTRSK